MCHARCAQAELRREAVRLADEYREANKAALLNLLSDSTAALTLFGMLLRNTEGRTALFSTFGRVISGLSDTAKAFLIIACACPGVRVPGQGCSLVHASSLLKSAVCLAGTDILLGYHSEEGWTAAIHLITGHYGYEVEVRVQCLLFACLPAYVQTGGFACNGWMRRKGQFMPLWQLCL